MGNYWRQHFMSGTNALRFLYLWGFITKKYNTRQYQDRMSVFDGQCHACSEDRKVPVTDQRPCLASWPPYDGPKEMKGLAENWYSRDPRSVLVVKYSSSSFPGRIWSCSVAYLAGCDGEGRGLAGGRDGLKEGISSVNKVILDLMVHYWMLISQTTE